MSEQTAARVATRHSRASITYVVTTPDGMPTELTNLVAFADVIYDRVWRIRKITPGA